MTPDVLRWRLREPPLPAIGMLTEGGVSVTLALALASRVQQGTTALRVQRSDDVLVVLAETDRMPWVDGATWIGRDGGILCPTTLVPDAPIDLVERAAQRMAEKATDVILTPTGAYTLGHDAKALTADQLTTLAAELAGVG